MKIDRVHIEHYKSLSNVTVEMHPRVTVLVGPNGSGKSNFVDALKFMRDLAAKNSSDAIDARGSLHWLIEQGYESDHVVCEMSGGSKKIHFDIQKSNGLVQHTRSGELREATRNWKFPQFSRDLIRPIEPVNKLDTIDENLKNWAAIFHKDKTPFDRAIEAMRVVIPDLVDVHITPAGNSYYIPTFHLKDDNGVEKSFDAAQLSDGTLHIFGLLLTLYQSPSPEVIVIEEPEQYLYPSMLALLADCIKEVSELTQIILTTHSHHLVEQFKLENIRVTTQKNGKTSISLVKKSQRYAVEQGLMTLGEIMAADGLYPELGDD